MLKRLLSFSGFKLGLIITLVYFVLKLWVLTGMLQWDLHDDVERMLLDLKFTTRGPQPDTKAFQEQAHVVIAAIDEKSMRDPDLGMWPWPRSKIGALVEQLNKCGARVIGFDVVFSEPDASRTAPVIEQIRKRYEEVANKDEAFEQSLEETLESVQFDKRFAAVLEDTENVVLGFFFFLSASEVESLNKEEVTKHAADILGFGSGYRLAKHPDAELKAGGFPLAYGARTNLDVLSEAVDYYGFFNIIPDDDGIYRRLRTLFVMGVEQDDGQRVLEIFPSLSLQMLALYYKQPIQIFVETLDGRTREPNYLGLFIGPYGPPGDDHVEIPVEPGGRLRLNFYGPSLTFLHVPVGDIIHGEAAACRAVDGKLVIVGATATGLFDLRPMPFEEHYPGVELHATAIENVITGSYLMRPNYLELFELVFVLFFGLAAAWYLNRLKLTWGLVITLALFGGLVAADFLVLFPSGLLAHLFIPYLALLSQFLGIAVYRYATEERQKRETRRAFQFYLSKDVIDSVLQDNSKLMLGGERRELTVLFSDIRGFTTISEGLAPEALTSLLNEYLTPMTDLVFANRGTLDKYMGDAVMAFYGAPVPFEDHPEAACLTALQMMDSLHEMQKGWRERGLPEIDIGIGLNTGLMSVGNMGSLNRFDYTVMGDHVNLGSRLEGLNKQYGTHIIISQFTHAAVGAKFTCRELDAVAVKGKKEPVRIFELVHAGPADPEKDAWIALSEEALGLYRAQSWDEAAVRFAKLNEERGDFTARMFVERCQGMKDNPPGEQWDGVFKMMTK